MDLIWALGVLWVAVAAALTAGLAHAAHDGFAVERELELHA